jgi:hypothetical protein
VKNQTRNAVSGNRRISAATRGRGPEGRDTAEDATRHRRRRLVRVRAELGSGSESVDGVGVVAVHARPADLVIGPWVRSVVLGWATDSCETR